MRETKPSLRRFFFYTVLNNVRLTLAQNDDFLCEADDQQTCAVIGRALRPRGAAVSKKDTVDRWCSSFTPGDNSWVRGYRLLSCRPLTVRQFNNFIRSTYSYVVIRMWGWPSDQGPMTGCWLRRPFSGISLPTWTPGTWTWTAATEQTRSPWKKSCHFTASR